MVYVFTTGKIINLSNITFGGKNEKGDYWVNLLGGGPAIGITAAEMAELQSAIANIWPYSALPKSN